MQIRDKDKFRQQLFDNYFSRFPTTRMCMIHG